jgi:hypothetical protein
MFIAVVGRERWLLFRQRRGAMEDKPGFSSGRSPSQARARKIRAEMEEIARRTQDALQRSRAIIEKSKTNSVGGKPGGVETEPDA